MGKHVTKQHKFYLYHEENRVHARILGQQPVIAKEFPLDADYGKDVDGLPITPFQAAHDFVQKIINPDDVEARKFGKLGFLSPEFLSTVSERCEATVKAAYAAAGVATKE